MIFVFPFAKMFYLGYFVIKARKLLPKSSEDIECHSKNGIGSKISELNCRKAFEKCRSCVCCKANQFKALLDC